VIPDIDLVSDDLYGTRTSSRWASPPTDPLNLFAVWRKATAQGVPLIAPCNFIPDTLAAWNNPSSRAYAAGIGAVHFFLDDYRFEAVWNKPARSFQRLKEVGAALTPDFSVWPEMPEAIQRWQVYRSRWCGAYWQHYGLTVIPTVSWAGPETYDFAFEGLPKQSILAVGSVGVRSADAKQTFEHGLNELVGRTEPKLIISYGKLPCQVSVQVREYPTVWDIRRKTWVAADHPAQQRPQAD
jgi:hypothetical protein